MNGIQYLVHVGYLLQLFALLARDILWLRGLLIAAQSLLALYAWRMGLWPYVFWNGLFVSINAIWVARLLSERRAVRVPDELKQIHEAHFAALTPPEFLRIWQSGTRISARDVQLVRENSKPDALYFLLSGEAVVRHGERQLAHLAAGNFIGEMSLLTGERTTADVVALGAIEYMSWPAEALARVRGRNPVLWAKIQSVLGHDLVEKIKRTAA
jgi:CRP-like cAMP-binding protein